MPGRTDRDTAHDFMQVILRNFMELRPHVESPRARVLEGRSARMAAARPADFACFPGPRRSACAEGSACWAFRTTWSDAVPAVEENRQANASRAVSAPHSAKLLQKVTIERLFGHDLQN